MTHQQRFMPANCNDMADSNVKNLNVNLLWLLPSPPTLLFILWADNYMFAPAAWQITLPVIRFKPAITPC